MPDLFRIALANLPFPATREASVESACAAIASAAASGAGLICFPECFIPGYRAPNRPVSPADAAWLESAYQQVAAATRASSLTTILSTERLDWQGHLFATCYVIHPDGSCAGFQDKVQLDPSEDALYHPGSTRHIFTSNGLTFGIVICHEGWRYPETVRWAARRGARIVFHPQFHEADATSFQPLTYADPNNSFHEKAVLCRAAENSIYFATVNYSSPGSPTTSAIANPDGTLLSWQPYGLSGLLIADLDLSLATGLLASRLTPN